MRLFNKARMQLTRNTKLGKYTLYAVGEILIVVLGIDIAINDQAIRLY